MNKTKRYIALHKAFMQTIKHVGIDKFKQATLFGRNDEVEDDE